ncbi:MAG TPA: PEP-CTERM sorting domain-containing protein [Chthoniobacteraceae bacterium]|nr:PEP-CTERM sorting domain-containing protein [Chthoniobacteraceae bacterium]
MMCLIQSKALTPFCARLAALFLLGGTTSRAATAIQIDVGANPLVAFDEELVFGWEFLVNAPIQLHHIGLFDAGSDGFERPWEVKIWYLDISASPNAVGFGPDTITEDGFTYVETLVQIGPHIHGPTLEPGRYVIAAGGLNFGDGDGPITVDPMPAQAAVIATDPAITFVQGRSGLNEFHDEDLVFPDTIEPGLKYFGPNFQFDVVPEPSIGLLLVAGAVLFGRRKKRQATVQSDSPTWRCRGS